MPRRNYRRGQRQRRFTGYGRDWILHMEAQVKRDCEERRGRWMRAASR